MPHLFFVGVDVGTSSARAALVNSKGQVLQSHVKPIITWNPKPDHYEQSSDDIWKAVCECVKAVTGPYPKHQIIGIGFDATCSLVALDKQFKPISVSTTSSDDHNIILWMDHRASKETEFINGTNHEVLKYVGGKVSLEMEIPKLLWLKNNLWLSTWKEAGYYFDLPDFLTWKCTDSLSRSLCSVVCKWNYDGLKNEWSRNFFETVGLEELWSNNFEKIGFEIKTPGSSIGDGLTEHAAEELGLLPGVAVSSSIIDAHAGALALFGCHAEDIDESLDSKMCVICGTSTCHMSLTEDPLWAPGVWGPYTGAIYPNMFLTEAGQSATGILIEHVVKTHPAYNEALKSAGKQNLYSYLNDKLYKMASNRGLKDCYELTRNVHVWPDYHGNRTPIADPTLHGMISGLSMASDEESLAITYLAHVQSLAYGTRHIMEALIENGRTEFKSILICGGLSKNKLFVQSHADICSIPVLLPEETEVVLVGAAILGACAAKVFPDLQTASRAMGGRANVVNPNDDAISFHQKKYEVFLQMLTDQRKYKQIMENK